MIGKYNNKNNLQKNGKTEVNSHEYISKVVMDGFSFNSNGNRRCVYYIKLPKWRIRYGDTKKVNTKYGAYTIINEEILDRCLEVGLGVIQEKSRRAFGGRAKVGTTKFSLSADDIDVSVMRRMFAFQYARDDMDALNVANIINVDHNKPILSIKNELIIKEGTESIISKKFNDYALVIGVSKDGGLMGSSFVVDCSSDYGDNTMAMAISKNILLILTNKQDKADSPLKYRKMAWVELDCSTVESFNLMIIGQGMKRRSGYIVSDSKELLEKYLKQYRNVTTI